VGVSLSQARFLSNGWGPPQEVLEPASRFAGPFGLGAGGPHLGLDLRGQARVAGQAEDVVNPVLLTLGHDHLAAEAAVGPQQDAHARPAGADPGDDAGQFLGRSGRGIDVRPPQLRRQQMAPAEDVEWQVAIRIVIAVEEPALLMSMRRIIGGIKIERDLGWGFRMRTEEEIDEQCLDGGGIGGDPGIAGGFGTAEFQTVQRCSCPPSSESARNRCDPPRACRPAPPSPGRGGGGRGRSGPRRPARCRRRAA